MALIALPFLPWYNTDEVGVGAVDFILDAFADLQKESGQIDLLLFMIPVLLIFVITQLVFVISLFRKGHKPIYPGTISLLLVGLYMIIFLFAIDILYEGITILNINQEFSKDFGGFIDFENWTMFPLIWFATAIVQKVVLFRLAECKFGKKS
ncbi:MAG: hypothetical protein IKV35_00050 [Clostridia bacterium]|nr:hypothetical protein [Clostridia bacterium]